MQNLAVFSFWYPHTGHNPGFAGCGGGGGEGAVCVDRLGPAMRVLMFSMALNILFSLIVVSP